MMSRVEIKGSETNINVSAFCPIHHHHSFFLLIQYGFHLTHVLVEVKN